MIIYWQAKYDIDFMAGKQISLHSPEPTIITDERGTRKVYKVLRKFDANVLKKYINPSSFNRTIEDNEKRKEIVNKQPERDPNKKMELSAKKKRGGIDD